LSDLAAPDRPERRGPGASGGSVRPVDPLTANPSLHEDSEEGEGEFEPGRETFYRLDREDVLRSVSGAWDDFARENDAPHLSGNGVVGRSIWDFITGDEVRHLSGILFSTVRERERPVSVPFRCDAPDIRRWMTLSIAPTSDSEGGIDISVRSLNEERRVPVRILDVRAPRSRNALRVCAWCKRARLGEDDWSEIEEAVERYGLFGSDEVPGITHGICTDCLEKVEDEISAS